LKKHSIEYIELRGVDGKNVSELSIDEAIEVKNKLDKNGIKVSAIGSPVGKISLTDNFENHVEMFKRVLKIAKCMETKYIRIFSFYYPVDMDMDECKSKVIKRLKLLTHLAEEENLVLLHENEKDIYGDIPERCLDIIKGVNSPNLKLTFDPANFIQSDIKPYPYAFNMLRPYIVYIHIKDAIAENGTVVPAGYGDGKIQDFLKDLKDSSFNGFLSIEPHLGSFEGLEKLERNVKIQNIKRDSMESFALAVNSLKDILNKL
jgi:sugar phosphate isomerase/epimerase